MFKRFENTFCTLFSCIVFILKRFDKQNVIVLNKILR